MDKMKYGKPGCPGGKKILSKGMGKGLGLGKGKGPIGKPYYEKLKKKKKIKIKKISRDSVKLKFPKEPIDLRLKMKEKE